MKLKQIKKNLQSAVLTGALSGSMALLAAVPSFAAAGWQKIGDKWYYYYENGQKATGLLQDQGKYYYLLGDCLLYTSRCV